MVNFIEENNKKKLTKCFILYLDEGCKHDESETVCNFKCLHCYYSLFSQRWKKVQKIKNEIDQMVSQGANHIQITGAEPTMHKDIFEIIDFINSKKVLCSVITNGYLLSIENMVQKYAGKIDYFLMSIHGYKDKWDEVSQVKGSWKKTVKALENCKKHNIEVHFNTTILQQNYKDLEHIIQLAMNYNVKRCNFICFNPFCSFETLVGQWQIKELIVSYDEMMPRLEKAFDLCQLHGIDFAMRYFPFCKVKKHMRKYLFNYSTLMFDWNEWNYAYWYPNDFKQHIKVFKKLDIKGVFEGSDEQILHHSFARLSPLFRKHFTEVDACKSCNDYLICDTPHTKQVELFPKQKFSGTKLPIKKNAKHYIELYPS